MKFSYKFSNLCGSVYRGGNLVFTADGNAVLSPVGNRVTVFDLVNHSSTTLPIEARRNIVRIALSPNGTVLITVDEGNHAMIISLVKRVVLGDFQLKKEVRDIQFSPDGQYLAITQENKIQVWCAPALEMQYRPVVLHREYTGHTDVVTTITWSPDSLFFATGSKDSTARVYSLHPLPGFIPLVLAGHKNPVVGVFFGQPDSTIFADEVKSQPGSVIYTVTSSGMVCTWKWKARPVPTKREIIMARRFNRAAEYENKTEAEIADDDELEELQNIELEAKRLAAIESKKLYREEAKERARLVAMAEAGVPPEETIPDELLHLEPAHKDSKYDPLNERVFSAKEGRYMFGRELIQRRRALMLDWENPEEEWAKLPFIARGTYGLETRSYVDPIEAGQRVNVTCAMMHGTAQTKKLLGIEHDQKNFTSEKIAEGESESFAKASANLLVLAFDYGAFSLYQMPDFTHIHTLTVSTEKMTAVAINSTGDWLAFGSAKLGQLLVWEWRSEVYVMKQQSHFSDTNCVAYSPDGRLVATGGEDGKVKIWNTATGFCFATFADHIGAVTGVVFSSSATVVISCGIDGTVRAYDLVRYRNFRTMTAPTPVQFTSLAIDPPGEVVVAGALDPFEIYVWRLQTGKLLDVLPGHTGPISGVAFNSQQSMLASCSWDKTVRLWDIFTSTGLVETLNHPADVLSIAYRPDGRELCASCLDGLIYVWDTYEGVLKFTIDGKRDIHRGRSVNDVRSAKDSTSGKAFTTLCYSADGTCILAGGNSKYVCIYELSQRLLIRKYALSNNLSYDAMKTKLNSKRFNSQVNNLDTIDDEDSDDMDLEERRARRLVLPGAKKAVDYTVRTTPPEFRVRCVRFSPTGQQWAACCTDGLIFYSQDDTLVFDPTELDLNITPETCLQSLEEKEYTKALVMALALNEKYLIERVLLSTPLDDVPLIARSLPAHRLERILTALADLVANSRHLLFLLVWSQSILTCHGPYIMKNPTKLLAPCRALQRVLASKHKDLAKICQENQYMLAYAVTFPKQLSPQELAERVERKQILEQRKEERLARAMAVDAAGLAVQLAEVEDSSDDELVDSPAASSFSHSDDEAEAAKKPTGKKSVAAKKKGSKKPDLAEFDIDDEEVDELLNRDDQFSGKAMYDAKLRNLKEKKKSKSAAKHAESDEEFSAEAEDDDEMEGDLEAIDFVNDVDEEELDDDEDLPPAQRAKLARDAERVYILPKKTKPARKPAAEVSNSEERSASEASTSEDEYQDLDGGNDSDEGDDNTPRYQAPKRSASKPFTRDSMKKPGFGRKGFRSGKPQGGFGGASNSKQERKRVKV